MNTFVADTANAFEVRYPPLAQDGPVLRFPCDDHGHVDLNALSARALSNYLFARAMVGRVYGLPVVGSVH